MNMFKITQEVKELPENFTGIAEYANVDKCWYLNGKLHRVDGPAIEYANGDKEWYLNGKQHRVGWPAFECVSGNKHWYLNGNVHREDGPAIEYANGTKEWWLNDKRFASKEAWQKALDKSKSTCDGKIVEIDGKKFKLVLSEG